MNEPNKQQQPSEGIFSMYEEVVEEIASLKRRPPGNAQEMASVLIRTVMPLIRDLAYYVREDRMEIEGLLDRDGGGSDETQFTPEDSEKFEMVVQFAKQVATAMAESPELKSKPEELAKAQAIVTAADECLMILEATTMGDDEEEVEGEAQEGATQEPS